MSSANRIWLLYKSTLVEWSKSIISANWPLELASVQMNRKPHILESRKITEARNPKWSS